MKKIILIFAFIANVCFLYAQNIFPSSGKVGIGTTSPSFPLTILVTGNPNTNILGMSDGTKGVLIQTQSTPTTNGGIIGYHNGVYNDLDIRAAIGTGKQLYLKTTGNVGIGTTTPDSKLSVNGIVHAKEVKVDLSGWPDYVFEKEYRLRSLMKVKAFIDGNGHLPEMPSEEELLKNGLKLGEISNLLTKKIEELTLYLIENKQQLIEQRKIIKAQNARIKLLEAAMVKPAPAEKDDYQ